MPIMRISLLRFGPACFAMAALACGAAQARTSVSVDLNLGLPIGGYYGHSYGGPVYAAPIYAAPVYATPVYAAPAYGTVYSALPAGAVSVRIGGGHYWRHGGAYYRAWGPRWVVVAPPVAVPVARAAPFLRAAAPPPAPRRPDPVITPRNGQGAAQTEYDRQQCNRWATTLPAAMAEASVFQRAVQACMDGRGYSMK
jgi:hypothetical protein